VIPFDRPLTLFVQSNFYQISDGKGAALAKGKTTKLPLQVASGQQVASITFTVTGAGH